MTVTYPDGNTKQFDSGSTFMDAAKAISEGFARKVIAARIDGDLYDLGSRIPGDVSITFLTFDDDEGRKIYWHSWKN